MALTRLIEEPAHRPADAASFVADLQFRDVPADVLIHARRAILDLIGNAAAAAGVDGARPVRDLAVEQFGPGAQGARMLFDGRRVSVPGAAMAGAAVIDSLDAHELSVSARGHTGTVLLPALLAVADETAPCSGAEFLTRFVVGYEVGVRAGISLLDTVGHDHCSGAWNGIGAAALCARALGLDREKTRHALGSAEYSAPRGQLRRCMDYPTMVNDGAAFSVQAAVSAALLAARGFTGAPCLLVEEEAPELWSGLGSEWLIREQHLSAIPVSRWAQPAVQAAADFRKQIGDRRIEKVVVETFEEAVRLTLTEPDTIEASQYSLAFPIAQMLVHGGAGIARAAADMADPEVLAMAQKVELAVSPTLSQGYPERRCARLVVVFTGGEVVETPVSEARGGPDSPLSDAEIVEKFFSLAEPVLGRERTLAIAGRIAAIERADDVRGLIDLLTEPVEA